MAIKLEKKTVSDKLYKVVSVLDDAIDWDKSYPDDLDSTVEEKKAMYRRYHELSKLVFLEDGKPTLFVFKHPSRVDISKKVRAVYTNQLSQAGNTQDLFTEIFNICFIGTEEGLDGGVLTEAERRGGVITNGYMQGMEDSGAFEEIAACLLNVINRGSNEDAKKK